MCGSTLAVMAADGDIVHRIGLIVERAEHLLPMSLDDRCKKLLTDALKRWLGSSAG